MNNENIKIAYFSAEIGLSSSLPTYSGGLGVLAGDHIKASANAGLQMLGISLLYKEGYFKQLLDNEGNQKEEYPRFELGDTLSLLPNKFSIKIRKRDVWIQAYEYLHRSETGHIIPIYFLGGVQIFLLGIIGEYIAKIYKEVKKNPTYSITDKIR